jgi:hypothetical protein
MTDQEINVAVAKLEYPDKEVKPYKDGIGAAIEYHRLLKYTECWWQMGQIIEREAIGVYPDSMSPVWVAFYKDIEVTAVSPTKAAALCYLMMKGSE